MKLALFAYTRRGRDTALLARDRLLRPGDECRCLAPEKLAGGDFTPLPAPCARSTGPLFAWADALVFVGAAGIAVRSIAPWVRDKRTDPAVLCVDELGRFIVPLLSGHIGGANALALRLAEGLGAVPVVTTATDVNGRFSVDAWAARQGLFLDSMKAAKAVSAAILEGPVPLCCDFPVEGELPPGVVRGDGGAVGVCVSWRRKAPFRETLLLVPPVLRLGLGCRRGIAPEAVRAAVEQVLDQHGIHPRAVKGAASIDLKRDEAGLLAAGLLQPGGAGRAGGGLHPVGAGAAGHRGGQRVRAGRRHGRGAFDRGQNRPGRRHRGGGGGGLDGPVPRLSPPGRKKRRRLLTNASLRDSL